MIVTVDVIVVMIMTVIEVVEVLVQMVLLTSIQVTLKTSNRRDKRIDEKN